MRSGRRRLTPSAVPLRLPSGAATSTIPSISRLMGRIVPAFMEAMRAAAARVAAASWLDLLAAIAKLPHK